MYDVCYGQGQIGAESWEAEERGRVYGIFIPPATRPPRPSRLHRLQSRGVTREVMHSVAHGRMTSGGVMRLATGRGWADLTKP